MMTCIYSWVHLSDMHFGHGNETYRNEQKLVLRELAKDILKQIDVIGKDLNSSKWRPNAIIISGDIAFSASEYKDGTDWLLMIANKIGVDNENIMLVPGNHDVKRVVKKENRSVYRLLHALRSGEEQIDEALMSDSDRLDLLNRIKAFLDFAEHINPLHSGLRDENVSFHWKKIFSSAIDPKINIRILGFNSALLCNDENDIKKLSIGTRALADSINDDIQERSEVVIVVSHHPFDWLRDEELVKRWITTHAQIHLCGHIHDQKAESYRAGGRDPFIRIVAGASHSDKTSLEIGSHGYNIAMLLWFDNKLVVRIYPRLWVDAHKAFGIDILNAVDNSLYSEYALEGIIPKATTTGSFFDDVAPETSSASSVIIDLTPEQVQKLQIPTTQFYSAFIPKKHKLYRIKANTTSGFVARSEQESLVTITAAGEKYIPVENSVYIIRDPIRPFEIQIGIRRAERPGGDPGIVPHVEGLAAESLHLMYPILVDESLKWLRMIFADLSTNPEVLNEIYHKDPDRAVRRMAARNPSATNALKSTECLFCDHDFLKIRMKQFESSSIFKYYKKRANLICNDYPYGPLFHYIVMPVDPIHSWQDIDERHLLDMNLLIWEYFREDSARLNNSIGIRIGLNSTIRHLVIGKNTRSSAGASVAHVHKQIWGMLPGSINLGDYIRNISEAYAGQTPPVDYLDSYLQAIHDAGLVIWEDSNKLVTLYVPFGQISLHELQIIVNRPNSGDYLKLKREEIVALSRAEYIVTCLYQKMGIQSFNEVLLSQPFNINSLTTRMIMTFITREVDMAVSELNLLYVVDKQPEETINEINKHIGDVISTLN